jgi:uncharacterized protein
LNFYDVKENLIKAMEELEIIDCHEHMQSEKVRTDLDVDVFTLFSHYTEFDLRNAGMVNAEYKILFDQRIPLDQRWKMFKPYWEQIRWSSYARAILLGVKKFYGFDDINDKTYQPLSKKMKEGNTPGIYERVLKDTCKIRVALTQCSLTDLGTPLLIPLMPLFYEMETWENISNPAFDPNANVRSLDDYLDVVRRYIIRVKKEGAVGMKMHSNPYAGPNRKKALSTFKKIRNGEESGISVPNSLRDYVVDKAISFATELDLVVAVHTGYWGDFRSLDPLHMIPVLERHPETKFDIYHLGYPWIRETLMLGKGFSNVWLNFCWTHVISQRAAVAGIDEAIDLIPMNKILAFGGDYGVAVEKIYGHLVMARENIAEALARRIMDRQMSESQAQAVVQKWFWDNPKELYKLDL